MVTARLGQSCAPAVASGVSNNATAAAPAMTLGMRSSRHSANEHKESRLVAHDGDVPLAGRGVLQSKHAAGRESPRLTVGRGDGKATLQDDAELSCGSRMIETLFEVLSAPARVESSEECARGRKVASDVDWRRRRREVFLAQLDSHVLKVRSSVGRAIEPRVGEIRSLQTRDRLPEALNVEPMRQPLPLQSHRTALRPSAAGLDA